MQRCVGRHLSGFIFTSLHQTGVAQDLDLSLVFRKTHSPAETLLVQAAQLRLVRVIVGWTQKRPAQSAPRHVGEISLYGFAFHYVDLVKVALGESKCILIQKFAINRDDAIAELIKRRFPRRCKTNFVASRFFQK